MRGREFLFSSSPRAVGASGVPLATPTAVDRVSAALTGNRVFVGAESYGKTTALTAQYAGEAGR